MSDPENDKPDQPSPESGGDKAAEPSEEEAKAAAEVKAKAAAAAKAKAEAAAKREAEEAAKPPWERDPQTPEWVEADEDDLVRSLRAVNAEAINQARSFAGDLVLEIGPDEIVDVCRFLKDDQEYGLLVDICGAHYPKHEEKPFEVVYIVYSNASNRRVLLKVALEDGQEVPSVTSVYAGANWAEREAYDMYGIRFTGHPDMTRILLWEGFNGYPLRKEFPVEGIDTGAAIYPEYYEETAGPVAGTGTGWKPPEPPAEPDSEGQETEASSEETETT